MKLCLRIVLIHILVSGTLAQFDGFDLSDALEPDPTPAKPEPKPTEKPKTQDPTPAKPKKPSFGDTGDFGFDLEDALKPDPQTDKPPVKPPKTGGGGGNFDDSDLFDVSAGDYKPDKGRSGGRAVDPGPESPGASDQTKDPDHVWGKILKQLYANMPEEVFVWISNLKQVLTPLLERAEDLLQALP